MAYRARYPRYRKRSKLRPLFLFILVLALVAYALLAMSKEMDFSIPGLDKLQETLGGITGGEPAGASGESGCEVHFIDVGQGDCELILSDGQAILIDAGENDQGAVVVDYLKKLGVQKIDLLIATHPHADHIGGLDTVVDSMEIGKIVMPRLPDELVPTTRTYTDFLTSIANKGLKITPARIGDFYDFGAGRLTILGPVADYDDLNDTSAVCRFDYGESSFGKRSFLFTGDMESGAEKELLGSGSVLKADVLKLGHHGSSTSTAAAFYQAVAPSVCVISCGEGNSYGHPNRETLDTIASNDAKVYRTDFQGSITVKVTDGNLEISTGRP